jgi:dihydrodipicolinate synthase/N-acetylneuraminate lyase
MLSRDLSGFSGDDAVTLPVIALGGVGVISVASNEIPHEMSAMTRAALNNDWPTARTLQRKYLPADAGQLHRIQSAAREGRPRDDGQD